MTSSRRRTPVTFSTPNGTVYKIHKRFGSPSVNSQVFLVSSADALGSLMVLKVSDITNQESLTLFENKLETHQNFNKVHALAPHFQLDKVVPILLDGGLVRLPHSPRGTQMFRGYTVEPFVHGFKDFESKCIDWFRDAQSVSDASGISSMVAKVMETFSRVSEALRMLLQFGFNHNDLHMRNVMVSDEDEIIRVMLIDFDWSMFHDSPPPFALQRTKMDALQNIMYFGNVERIKTQSGFAEVCLMNNALDCGRRFVGHMTELLKDAPCEVMFFIIHALHSYTYYVMDKPSPSVDLAHLCIDFSKKFMATPFCNAINIDTPQFDVDSVDVVGLRKMFASHEAQPLRRSMRLLKAVGYDLASSTTTIQQQNEDATIMNI